MLINCEKDLWLSAHGVAAAWPKRKNVKHSQRRATASQKVNPRGEFHADSPF